MFTSKDKTYLHDILEKLNSKGDNVGKVINIKGKKLFSIIIISLTIITIGTIIFLTTLLRSSIGKNNEKT